VHNKLQQIHNNFFSIISKQMLLFAILFVLHHLIFWLYGAEFFIFAIDQVFAHCYVIFFLLLDRKGLLCVEGASVYVESPTKVDSLFPIFFKKVHSFFWIFLNRIADFVLWTVVFLFFYRYSVLFECIYGFFFLWCKNVT